MNNFDWLVNQERARQDKKWGEQNHEPMKWACILGEEFGELQREPCALCGQEQGEAHHLDYNEPLLIVWLCGECHRKVHIEDKG